MWDAQHRNFTPPIMGGSDREILPMSDIVAQIRFVRRSFVEDQIMARELYVQASRGGPITRMRMRREIRELASEKRKRWP